jgi:sugar/nucleoside kinase (ribokinase family)
MKMFNVYLYGMISASTVHVLDRNCEFPKPNEYAEIKETMPSVGGEAVNSAIMLSKLGIKTKLDGNWINPDNADKIFTLLKPFGIDYSRLTLKQNYGTEEVVITDKSSRTVFGNYAAFHSGEMQWNDACEDDIRNAKMVSLDPYFKKESLAAAELCVKNNKPYVTIDCRYDDFITQNAEAVIISHELRDQAYRDYNMEEIFSQYLQNCKGLIIFTFGSDELWYGRQGQEITKYKPYKINPIDTTGAGDSFRSGIIYGLLNSWSDEKTVDFASAVAACVCLTMPHTLNAPGLDGVLKFIEEYNKFSS